MTWLKNYFGQKYNPANHRPVYEGLKYAIVWLRDPRGGKSAYILANKRSTETKDRRVVLFEGLADVEDFARMKQVLEEKEKGVPSA